MVAASAIPPRCWAGRAMRPAPPTPPQALRRNLPSRRSAGSWRGLPVAPLPDRCPGRPNTCRSRRIQGNSASGGAPRWPCVELDHYIDGRPIGW